MPKERKVDGKFIQPTVLKYGMTDPGKPVDPKRIEDMQARIFCEVPRPPELRCDSHRSTRVRA